MVDFLSLPFKNMNFLQNFKELLKNPFFSVNIFFLDEDLSSKLIEKIKNKYKYIPICHSTFA